MKIFWSSILAIILAGAISYFVPVFTVSNTTLNTLFTVAGIMFSIGMSLSVTSNTSGIKNRTIRSRIRRNMKKVRNYFIYQFLFTSLFYIASIQNNYKYSKLYIQNRCSYACYYYCVYHLLYCKLHCHSEAQ